MMGYALPSNLTGEKLSQSTYRDGSQNSENNAVAVAAAGIPEAIQLEVEDESDMPRFSSAKCRKMYPRKYLHDDGIYSHFYLIEDGNGDFKKYCVGDKAHNYFVVQCKSCATA